VTGRTHPPPPAVLEDARLAVEPVLRAAVGRLAPGLGRVAGYHLGWLQADGSSRRGGGKAMRPALVLLSAEAAGGRRQDVLPVAAAAELVHNFSLLHDDVVDRDTERRHRPTAWTVFGQPAALLAGNALFTLAVELLLDSSSPNVPDVVRCLTSATQDLIAGQAEDVAFEQRMDVTVAECLAMAAGKTSSLLACCCRMGAVAVGGSAAVTGALTAFGADLGMAFQLVDDLLGIWGDPEVTGKPVLADIRAGKKSLPVVYALRAGGRCGERLADVLSDGGPGDEEEVVLAAKLVEEAGGRDWAAAEANRRLEAAQRRLAEVPMAQPARAELDELARFVTARES
jgi:geranylgeranyl diphosphate synthase, type I